MNVYDIKSVKSAVSADPYVGRGIIIGQSADGKSSAFAYFIMGRSVNSRNRIFTLEGRTVKTKAFDESKMSDPSLVIYAAVRDAGSATVVTNGDQTDTVCDGIAAGGSFESALRTRCFEPDAPNLTPRISGILEKDGSYKMSILKSADAEGSACNRYFFEFAPISGIGHFIHTYVGDGNPLPTFQGEPERVAVPNSIDEFANEIWENLNEDNKISLYVRYIDKATGEISERLFNKNK